MMLSVSCCCYFLLKKYITNPVFEGLAIFVVSTITNELQRQCCKFFVGQSNIKYLKTRNDVYMFTISSYRLINVNLPVFYAILWPGFADSKSEHYSKMYVLVLTIVISKVFAFLFFQYAMRGMIYSCRKASYFRKVSALSKKQTASYLDSKLISAKDKKDLQEKSEHEMYKGMMPVLETPAEDPKKKRSCCKCCYSGLKQPLTYMRLVLVGNQGQPAVSETQAFTDNLELNSLMPKFSELQVIINMTEKYVMFSLALLYAGLCPLATVVVGIFYLIDCFLEQYMDCNVMQRGLPDIYTKFNYWVMFAEAIILISLITNSFMLYNYSTTFEETLNSLIDDEKSTFFYVVAMEHIVIFFVITIKILIPDMPNKIKKFNTRVKSEIKSIHKIDLTDSSRVEELEKELETLKEKMLSMTSKKPTDENTALAIIRHHQKDKEQIEIKEGSLADFLRIDPREHNYDQLKAQMEIALRVNLEIRLFRETFYLIERAIIHRKLQMITKFGQLIQIACCECTQQISQQFCPDCADHYCDNCATTVHKTMPIYETHKMTPINVNPKNAVTATGPVMKGDSIWRKLEYFNFPLNPMNTEMFHQIQMHFEHLKRVYVDMNHINAFKSTCDIAAVLVDQNYESLARDIGTTMKKSHVNRFGEQTILMQKETLDTATFNNEELFYLNRVAFRLFKKSGAKITFEKFHSDLNTLQHGEFDLRLKLWLKLVNEMEQQVTKDQEKDINLKSVKNITKQKLGNVVRASYPQDLTGALKADQIVDTIFGAETVLPMVEIMEKIQGSPQVLALFQCVLQFSDGSIQTSQTLHSTL